MSKPILCLDFDGVIHSYSSGWMGADVIPDPPVPGAVEFLDRAIEEFRVSIYSSRSHQPHGILAMQTWLRIAICKAFDGRDQSRADAIFAALEWPDHKPSAMVTIDDRALTFDGTWPAVGTLRAFQPWNKRPSAGHASDCAVHNAPAYPPGPCDCGAA